jgi:hypothetical protein
VSDSLVLRILENTQEWVNDYLVSRIHCEQDCERLFSFENTREYTRVGE